MPSANDSIQELAVIEPIKVWSLLITLLGDLGHADQEYMSGKKIRTLLSHIGIQPNAIRVALHRLKKEGWIVTSKASNDGREVMYALSTKGLDETRAVYEDVYRSDIKYADGWKLQILEGRASSKKTHGLPVFNHVTLVPAQRCDVAADAMTLDLDKNAVPTWLLQRVLASEVFLVADRILSALSKLDESLAQASVLDRAAVRLLVLHLWRRLALRDSTWLHIWLYDDGVLSQCHQNVTRRLGSI